MARVKWTPTAERDLTDIVLYISDHVHHSEVAKSIYHEIKEKCLIYAENPLLGISRSDLCTLPSDAFRSFVYKRWVVIYEPRDDGIEVFAVLDGSRRYETYFLERNR